MSFEVDVLAATQAGLAPYFDLASLHYQGSHFHDSQPGCYAITGYNYDRDGSPAQFKACHNVFQESPTLVQFEGVEWRKITKVAFVSTSANNEARRCFVDDIRVRFYAASKRAEERDFDSGVKNSNIINVGHTFASCNNHRC